MPLKINNAEISNLFVNGTEFNALRINDTSRFGKRFSLTQNSSMGVYFSVKRTSSPNQQAGTGTVTAGNTIFYGDQITISGSLQSNYVSAQYYVNIGDGQGMAQRSLPFSFTVTANVLYYGTATYVPPAAMWQEVLSNYDMINWDAIAQIPEGGPTEVNWQEQLFEPGRPTKITLRLVKAWIGRGFDIQEELDDMLEAEPPFTLQNPFGQGDFFSADASGLVETNQVVEASENGGGYDISFVIIDLIEQYF